MSQIYDGSFKVGVLVGLSGLVGINLYTIFKSPDHSFKICFDCYETYGFPFPMYETGTIAHLNQFMWAGVVANIAVAIMASVVAGLAVSKLSRLVKSRGLR